MMTQSRGSSLAAPVLDELSMNECFGKDVRVILICAPVLTKLRYNRPQYPYKTTEDFGHKIVIDTPALQYLELIDYEAEVHLVNNLCHIIKAEISIALQYDQNESKVMTDLLMGLSQVQCLHLHKDCSEAIRNSNSQLPMFHNLTSLVLGAGYVGQELFSQLLEKLPRLETLAFDEGCLEGSDDEDDPLDCYSPQYVPSCVLSHLKSVKFLQFQGADEELKIVGYFLKNAQVLEKLIIHCNTTYLGGEELEFTTKILMLPRGSRNCQVEFVMSHCDR